MKDDTVGNDTVRYRCDDHIGVITLNRPHRLNAINLDLLKGFMAQLDRARQDEEARVIKDAGIDAISSTPSYPNHLEKVIREAFDFEPADLGLSLGLFGGEPGLDNPVYRERIEKTWGMKAQNANYGVLFLDLQTDHLRSSIFPSIEGTSQK